MNYKQNPVLIGAIGGSGTRVFAKIARHAGVFMGSHLNIAEDAEPFIDFYDAWIPLYLHKKENLPQPVQQVMEAELYQCIQKHLSGMPYPDARWGVKNPKSIHMIKLWNQLFPNLKFIHVIRNGLDVAYSMNQGQFYCYKDLVFDQNKHSIYGKPGILVFWHKINQMVSEFGETELKERYLRIRLEDLCNDPKQTVTQIFEFLEVKDEEKLAKAIAEVAYPSSIGRWRSGNLRDVYETMKAGKLGLENYGYWNNLAWQKIEEAVQFPRWQRFIFQNFNMKNLPLV